MNIGQLVNKIPVQRLARPSETLVDSQTLLGVEVECENVNSPLSYAGDPRASYWTAKKDDSLRNGGMEFVFTDPLYGADAVAAIEFLCEHAKHQGYTISTRTGLHAHVDVRNMEVSKFRNFCTTYAIVEPLIYNFIGDKRSGNMFCLPWWAADTDVEKFSRMLPEAETNPHRTRENLRAFHKYSGLNLQALVNFGTVEFRQMRTTFDSARILDWLNIILSIRKFAVEFNGGPNQLCGMLQSYGAYVFASKVFGSLISKVWYPEYTRDAIGKGLVTAEWFLESNIELWMRENKGASVFDYILSKKKDSSQPVDAPEREHPGIVAFRKKAQPQGKAKKRKVPELQPANPIIGSWVGGGIFTNAQAPTPPQHHINTLYAQMQAEMLPQGDVVDFSATNAHEIQDDYLDEEDDPI
jgi:hypothetical protein